MGKWTHPPHGRFFKKFGRTVARPHNCCFFVYPGYVVSFFVPGAASQPGPGGKIAGAINVITQKNPGAI